MAPTRNTIIVERLSSAFSDDNKGDLSQVCDSISSEILRREITLCEVVEQLGELLTSTDISVRANGVLSLSTIIQKLPQDFLNPQEVQLLTSFYCDRLKDHHSIIPSVILGILAIVQMTNLPGDAPGKLFHTLTQNVRCQSELSDDRRNIYLILQSLLNTRIDDLKALGPDFVYGVISSMDGESHPRNLSLLFNILPKFMEEFSLGHLTEEMFEVISCYFPLDYTSDWKEGRNILREELANGLERCLVALPEFAEFCIPLLIGKLDSSLKVAKLDSLSLLSASSSKFGVEGLKDYLDDLWMLMRRDLMSGSDQAVREMGLKAITDVVGALAQDPVITEKFVGKIITDTKSSLCDVQLSLFWPAEKVLEAVAKGGKEACIQVLRAVIPLCLGQYSTKTSTDDKIILLETLNSFIAISGSHGFRISDVPELSWTDVPNLYLNELNEGKNSIKSKSLRGLALQVSSLSESHRQTLYDKLCGEIDAGSQEIESACHSTLSIYGRKHPQEVLQLLQARLKVDVSIPIAVLESRLAALSSVVKIPDFEAHVLPSVLEVAVAGDLKAASAALTCLLRLLEDETGGFDIHYYLEHQCKAVERLVESVEGRTGERMRLVSNICCSIVRRLSPEAQRIVVERHFETLRSRIAEDIILLEGIITPQAPEIAGTIGIGLLEQLFEISLKGPDEETRLSACRLISILVNKVREDCTLGRYLNIFRESLTQILEEENRAEEKRAAVILHTWLTKSLLVKGSRESQNFLDYQLNMLKNETVGAFVGEQFRVLVERGESTLTVENQCTVKIFYKQRIFQNIIQQNSVFEGAARENYLIALSHLVEEIPVELMALNLSKIVPPLIESLSMESSQLLLSTLNTLGQLLKSKEEIFAEYIDSFIPKCLKLSAHPKMLIRIAALNCLHSYCSYPTPIILMCRNDVIDKLSEALDDKKRLVRKIAVKTRTRWYLVGAPGGPD
ncbi:MMS19 nucleotide excision repair protein homolog [Fopius arisanus]|uniref:MMS19 nucleotide excision repair protein n=1 Tax=Fopius arisanus TaxID=64838 RepID=A0A9R1STX6_9HYME|nr:PREDICTED: MMS19 nucleotide excision repair protein homolog [Fopius arisanus]